MFNFVDLDASPGRSPKQGTFEAIASLLAITQDEIRVALDGGLIDPAECAPRAVSLTSQWDLLNLTTEARTELGRRLTELIDEYRGEKPPGVCTRPYRVLVTLFPTYLRGERPPGAAGATEQFS